MTKRYTSLILLSKFLGNSVLKDTTKVEDLVDAIMEMSYKAKSINFDLLVMAFGIRFVNKGWRKKDR